MTMKSVSVLLYTTNEFTTIQCFDGITSEELCMKLCVKLSITPAACLLFALRISGTKFFIPADQTIRFSVQYEFRLRFEVSQLSTLKRMDRMAYNYFYHQVKCDLIGGKIPELVYPKFKDQVTGLCVTNMYNEMLDNQVSVEILKENYKKYVPEKYVKKHSFVIQKCISKTLDDIKNRKHDSYYVKETFLESIKTMAPNYLVESCTAEASYPIEDGINDTAITVNLEFAPFHVERPGFSIYYPYKKMWKHISQIEDIYAIIVEGDIVKFEMRSSPVGAGFQVKIQDLKDLGSFVSCISGYYRLMVKWTVNLCSELTSPSLKWLLDLRCHGPIGGECAYTKLQEARNTCGSYIVRQCEKSFHTYYIDIIMAGNVPGTFKITHENNLWHLHMLDSIKGYSTLQELIKSINTASKQKFRLAPSEYDKFATLLLCLPPSQMTAKKALSEDMESEMRQRKTQILNSADFRKYIKTKKFTNNGIITEMKAEWCLPNNMKLDVTLKILNKPELLSDFMGVAEKWSVLNSPELIKLYGFTLSSPATFVIESIKHGPLDEFLRGHNDVNVGCMIDAAHSLARALHYLQEQGIAHGRIRCSSLKVIRYDHPNLLIVRLGDPFGKTDSFNKNDEPWIPIENSRKTEITADLKGDVLAYATTLWEIFSRGRVPILKDSTVSRRLPRPPDCPPDIYKIMLEGWNPRPDQRFSPQAIFVRLVSAKEAFINSLSNEPPPERTISISGSIKSGSTERTTLSEGSISSNGGVPEHDWDDDDDDDDTTTIYTMTDYPTEIQDTLVFELPDGGKIVSQGEIGRGHYGVVYRGTYELNDTDPVTEVAIKMLNNTDKIVGVQADFEREMKIMMNLNHKNIVKIITHMDEPLSIVMEFVKHRSFLLYLSANAPLLDTKKLLKFAKDIASGMEYLVSHKIVHRDLAARNVLVDNDDCVKISDFGLAQKIGSNGYYEFHTDRAIPIKWYAPETLRLNKYSFKSDVWSFGVTLFEMFSRGCQPDLIFGKELGIIPLVECLEQGQRLKKPKQCPDDIYDSLMMACWNKTPKERPSFTMLISMIDNFIGVYNQKVF